MRRVALGSEYRQAAQLKSSLCAVAARDVFIGFGVGTYSHLTPNLPKASAGVLALAKLLAPAFEAVVDPDEKTVRTTLRQLVGRATGGTLTLLWSGHGVASAAGLRLFASDSEGRTGDGFGMADLAARGVESGAGQVLLLLDGCFSGAGVDDAGRVAAELLQQMPPDAKHLWVGVVASCLGQEKAREGVFAQLLQTLLSRGPTDADLRRRWSRHNERLQGHDLCDALVKEWASDAQTPVYQGRGSSWWMFSNPLYESGAPAQVVEHLLRAARGGEGERSWFTGRVDEVNEVVGWVTGGARGIRVVTGSPGTGKSAILGRVVSLSNTEERARLLPPGVDPQLPHLDPQEGSVAAHVHARGLTRDRAAQLLDQQLVRAAVLPALQEGWRNAAELVGAFQRVAEADEFVPPVLAVDGLDEARGEAFNIAQDLLVELGRFAAVVVATRNLPPPAETTAGLDSGSAPVPAQATTELLAALTPVSGQAAGDLLTVLAPVGMLDLDDPERQASGHVARHDYVAARLRNRHSAMDADLVAGYLDQIFEAADRPFLLARLVTDQLIETSIDTTMPHWQRLVASTMEAAFDTDLARIDAPPHRHLPEQVTPGVFARQLLTALTWGLGAGFPEHEWRTVAAVLTAVEVSPDDISWILNQLGRYVLQDGEAGTAVYRLAHQSLADHLRPPFRGSHDHPFDLAASPVAAALATLYRDRLATGLDPTEPSYLWRYVWRHIATAGPEGLPLLGALAAAHSDLEPDVAYANNEITNSLASWGRYRDALTHADQAVKIQRKLSNANDLAKALVVLGACYNNLGRYAEGLTVCDEAVEIYRELAVDAPGYRPNLALALVNLSGCCVNLGRYAEGLAVGEEAVEIYRELAVDAPGYRPNRALALVNLSSCYIGLGRYAEGLTVCDEAVEIYRELAVDAPGYRPNLAMALGNLGACYLGLGRYAEGLAVCDEAVEIYRELAVDAPGYRPNLALALGNLGACYAGLGRYPEGLTVCDEAVEIYRELAVDAPGYRPNLATALTNMGACYLNLGRYAEGLTVSDEAVEIYRELAVDAPGYRPSLAAALGNLGACYLNLERYAEGLTVCDEAVEIYRELAVDAPGHRPNLATALVNLSSCYIGLGRYAEGLTVCDEAVEIYRELAVDAPGYRPNLAMALTNLGTSYSNLGRDAESLALSSEAVEIYRELAAYAPGYRPNLAIALLNLGASYFILERYAEGLTVSDEAVEIYRELAVDAPGYRPNLAMTLLNLGATYVDLGRHNDNLTVSTEALGIYRDLAADTTAYRDELARALQNLGDSYTGLGQPENIDAIWQDVLDSLPDEATAELLLYRSEAQDGPIADAAGWLAAALEATHEPRLAAELRDEARRHRAMDPAGWDEKWLGITGEPVPGWMAVNRALVERAREWFATPSYKAERDYLAGHLELLDPDADLAVSEALSRLSPDERALLQDLRAQAREVGVASAYRPLLLRALASEFVEADPARQRELLVDRRQELLTDDVADQLHELAEHAEEPAERQSAEVAIAVVALAQTDQEAPAMDALEDPTLFTKLLTGQAAEADPQILSTTARIAMTTAATRESAADAHFYLAVAAIRSGDQHLAETELAAARSLSPARSIVWITQLAELGRRHTEVLALIPALAAQSLGVDAGPAEPPAPIKE
jgi:tetratricopeptide (TPR) repeat protein